MFIYFLLKPHRNMGANPALLQDMSLHSHLDKKGRSHILQGLRERAATVLAKGRKAAFYFKTKFCFINTTLLSACSILLQEQMNSPEKLGGRNTNRQKNPSQTYILASLGEKREKICLDSQPPPSKESNTGS